MPVWLIFLSEQLPVIGLVGRYLTNYLMGRGPLKAPYGFVRLNEESSTCGISKPFGLLFPTLR